MAARFLDNLPDAIARPVRVASVPAELRALFAHLPERIALDARLPDDPAAIGAAACELLKLASLGGAIVVRDVTTGASQVEIALATAARRHDVPRADLDAGIHVACRRALEALLDPAAFTRALEAFAAQSARLAALQTLTRHMLLTEDLEQALGVMLAGVTSGSGLGFNRAAIFVREESGAFAGAKAIGPHDESEAHRIWEEIEYERKSFEDELADSVRLRVDARLEAFVRGLTLTPSDEEGDEVAAAIAGTAPIVFAGTGRVNPSLARLAVTHEIVLAPIAPRGAVRALLYADLAFSRAAIDPERIAFLGFFIDQVALVWDNLTLLRKVEQLARFDELTGVHNRRGFDERFADELSRAARARSACSIVVIDVDRFKEINDQRGHAAGDEVLRALGAILRDGVRTHDTAARLGGDELALLLPEASREEAVAVALRVGAAARAGGISISIGVATWPEDCAEPAKLLTMADDRLYEAKRAGRGRASVGDGRIVLL